VLVSEGKIRPLRDLWQLESPHPETKPRPELLRRVACKLVAAACRPSILKCASRWVAHGLDVWLSRMLSAAAVRRRPITHRRKHGGEAISDELLNHCRVTSRILLPQIRQSQWEVEIPNLHARFEDVVHDVITIRALLL
jgi:hypothetical protein